MKITFKLERVFGLGLVLEWQSLYGPALVLVVGPLVVSVERQYS